MVYELQPYQKLRHVIHLDSPIILILGSASDYQDV